MSDCVFSLRSKISSNLQNSRHSSHMDVIPRIKDLSLVERKQFTAWLEGQTCPLIEGIPMDEQDGYFSWDYERWKAGVPAIG